MTDRGSVAEPAVTPVGGGVTGEADGPTVVVRPRLALRVLGPRVLGLGLAAASVSVVAAGGLVVGGLVLTLAWIPRVEVRADEIRHRGLFGSTSIRRADVTEVRLRRVRMGRSRPPHRSYRVGPVSTTPIRLIVVGREDVIQVAVAGWEQWPRLVRILLETPGVESDSRTRGRLDRYG
ncbi:MAG: hypothetical protein ACXV8Y_07460 [Acidimicrobiia bacterium]